MLLGLNQLFDDKAEINAKYITAIKVLCGRSYKVIYLDDRTKGFRETKPFAYSNGDYYVACPCCHQIEKVSDNYFVDGNQSKIQCSNRTITRKTRFKATEHGIKPVTFRNLGYTLNLDDWKS